MNARIIQVRNLDKKFDYIKNVTPIIPEKQSWIKTIRQCLGMSARQLAARLEISQARVAKMEQNEENLKVVTLKKIAKSMNCTFVPIFIPNESIEKIIDDRAGLKAKEILNTVNQNMALENQKSNSETLLEDLKNELIQKSIRRIWD